MKLDLTLSAEQAEALAQFAKRARLDSFRALASTEAEAYLMQEAVRQLAQALADAGHDPR